MSGPEILDTTCENLRGGQQTHVARGKNHAKLSGPEKVTAPVLEAPEPSELNQRGIAPTKVAPTERVHFVGRGPRTQEACLMIEFQEARSAVLGALQRLVHSDAPTAAIRLEVDATKKALESLLALARGGENA